MTVSRIMLNRTLRVLLQGLNQQCVNMHVFLWLLFLSFVDSSPHLDHLWNSYKTTHNKTFHNHRVEALRRRNWESNHHIIHKHNEEASSGLHSYTLRANHLADFNVKQYIHRMVRLAKSRKRRLSKDMVAAHLHITHSKDVPEEFNWVDKGFVTPTINQGDCGSCYAFSIATAVEGQIFKNSGKMTELSAQQLVDCSTILGNLGCVGGSLRNTLRYLAKYGIMNATDYPYSGKDAKCKLNTNKISSNISSWAILPPRDEKALQIAVAKIGPIAASINANPRTFQLYHSGVYSDEACTSNMVNHAIVVVGYTKDAWIIKNWWSDHWGETGYMRLKRHANLCGIANYAAYPLM